MAYINVAEWSPDQVTDWLKGLDHSMYKYVKSFANNEINGQKLLNIRPYELNELGITKIGPQEIVLEAVEQLRSFNYHLEKENLQFLALHVATTAKNLHHQLAYYSDKSKIETQILNDITRAIATIKPLVGWLDRSPFHGQLQFNEIRKRILRLGIEMATSAQRDRFVENPVDQIRLTAEKLSKLADYIIQDISDPIILQPATLNLVTLKKRESELGFSIVPNYHGIHVITDIKYNSSAHISGKIEDGDEIIQINYQTVVGWHYNRVLQQLQESPPDVLLTLKKRPRHTKIYGQIYIKPYRLPSKKRSQTYRFSESLPSPRIEFIPPQNFPVLLPLREKDNLSDSDSSTSSTSSILMPVEATKTNEKDIRLYLAKPRAVLQRRNTICGDHVSGFRGNITFWHEMNIRRNIEGSCLRDKSVSFGFGLEISSVKRPITCVGMHNKEKYDLAGGLKGSLPDITATNENAKQITPIRSTNVMITHLNEAETNPSAVLRSNNFTPPKVVKFNTTDEVILDVSEAEKLDKIKPKISIEHQSVANAKSENSNKGADSTDIAVLSVRYKQNEAPNSSDLAEAINVTLIKTQKTHEAVCPVDPDKPPEIGPRREFLSEVAPLPPPRPSKAAELVQRKFERLKQDRSTPDLQTNIKEQTNKPESSSEINKCISKASMTNDAKTDVRRSSHSSQHKMSNEEDATPDQLPSKSVLPKYSNPIGNNEETELLTPNKTKSLTLKKKNSILAKRRRICLKTLEVSDIQGHLFRRTKDKHGVTYWAKLYFVLVETALYGFRNKKSQKADCLIFLPGFTISLAKEVHSKPYAYKVYHAKKTFYFAAESEQALSQWMDYIKRATSKGIAINVDPMSVDNKDLFSETDSSDDEGRLTSQNMSFKHGILGGGKTSKKRGAIDDSLQLTQKNEKYHLKFGSLKKLTNLHGLHFSSNKSEKDKEERKKTLGDIPVQPTPQFKSYRKIHGNVGMQLGSNSIEYSGLLQRSQQNQTQSKVPSSPVMVDPIPSVPKNLNNQSEHKSVLVAVKPTIEEECGIAPAANPCGLEYSASQQVKPPETQTSNKSISKLSKSRTSPHNYMHASNPNLVEFTFQTSKTLDVGMPKVNVSNTFDHQHNLQGFITLKDLMLQQEEDEAHNMYNNRVNLGIEKPSVRNAKRRYRRPTEATTNDSCPNDENENSSRCNQKQNVNKIQRRSLPKTPDYAQSFKADDTEIIMARSKEGQKLRDFGYEFISGDDMNNGKKEFFINNNDGTHNTSGTSVLHSNSLKNTTLAKTNDRLIASNKRKGLHWIGLNLDNKRNDDEKNAGKGSFKAVKQKSPVISKNDDFNKNFHTIQTSNSRSDSINSSFTNGERKRSVVNSTFHLTKLTFPTNKTVKEKRLLGSPCLHRAATSIFGRKSVESPTMESPISPIHDSISNFEYNSAASSPIVGCLNVNTAVQGVGECKICTVKSATNNEMGATGSNLSAMKLTPLPLPSTMNSLDQSMEYPPIFVPETYRFD